MTLAQLSAGTGLSEGFLSQIERQKASPSFSSLLRISGAFNVPMSALISGGPDRDDEPQSSGRIRHKVHPSGIYRDRFITPPEARTIQVLEAILEPGNRSRVAPYVHAEEEECIVILDGELEFRSGETVHRLSAGDSLLINPQIPHSYKNPGSELVRWLWISARAPEH